MRSDEGPLKKDARRPLIAGVNPRHSVPGGRLKIEGEWNPRHAHQYRVRFGDSPAHVTTVTTSAITALVPDEPGAPEIHVDLDGESSPPFRASLARLFAGELHPVANPVFDRDGNLLVTFSGSRGQKVPVSIFLIDPAGRVKPFLSDVLNATGLAFDRDGDLYVSSRHEGAVYRVSPERRVELVADELGVATGLAFDGDDILYVGDRQGTVYRIERNGEPRVFCRLPPSVSAYHLAFDRKGNLYVSGPSLASVDGVYVISPETHVEIFCSGFGRPQGLAFDKEGSLYVTEALAGDSGVHRITATGARELLAAGPPLVGLAFDDRGGLVLAGTSSVFLLKLDLEGKPL